MPDKLKTPAALESMQGAMVKSQFQSTTDPATNQGPEVME